MGLMDYQRNVVSSVWPCWVLTVGVVFEPPLIGSGQVVLAVVKVNLVSVFDEAIVVESAEEYLLVVGVT